MTPKQKKELYSLLNDMCEGVFSEEQHARLDEILKSDRQACEIYVDFTSIWSNLRYFQTSLYSVNQRKHLNIQKIIDSPDEMSDSVIWRALMIDEKTAPAVEIPKAEPRREIIQKVVYEKHPTKVNKFNMIAAISSIAAIILIVVGSRFLPSKASWPVASITSSINAQWSDSKEIYQSGTRLWNDGSWYCLTEGIAEVAFDSGAKVLIESPSRFQVLNENEMSFEGILTAKVPDSAYGFIVHTSNFKVVDLGTEFGLINSDNTGSEICVRKGKVHVTESASGSRNPLNQLLKGGQGCCVSSTGIISKIEYNADQFLWDMPNSYEYAVIKTDPLYYWRFDRGQEEILRSEMAFQIESENYLKGQLDFYDGPQIGGDTTNQAIYFSGSKDSYLVLNDNPADYGGATGLSISMWIRPEVSKMQDIIVHRKTDSSLQYTDEITLTDDNCVRFYVFCPPDTPQPWPRDIKVQGYNSVRSNPISLNHWTHIVAAYTDEGMMNLYINGQLEASKKLSSRVERYPQIDCWYIGSDWQDFEKELTNTSKNFVGSIDEISRYNRELSVEEVRLLYESAQKSP